MTENRNITFKKVGMRLLIVLLICSLFVGCSKKAKPDEPVKEEGPTAQESFLKGNEFLNKRSWPEAVEHYDAAAKVAEGRWDIFVNRGIAQVQMGKFRDAINSFDLALKNGGAEESSVYYNLGNVYQERGLYSDAIDAYRTGLAFTEKPDTDMLNNLAASYVYLHRYDAAIATYEHLRSIAPDDPRPIHGLGMVQFVQTKYNDAIETFQQVNSGFPDFALAYYVKGLAHARKKQWSEAVTSFESYLAADPDTRYRSRVESRIATFKIQISKGK